MAGLYTSFESHTDAIGLVDLSIVIVNWNTRAILSQCLDSVERCIQTETSIKMETIVVDNGSRDSSVSMVQQKYQWARLIKNELNLGFAQANNLAIMKCHGRYVLLLNSDAFLEPSSLRCMVEHLDKCPEAGIVSVCLAFPDGRPQFCYGDFPSVGREFRSLFGMHSWDLSIWGRLAAPIEVDWVSGACMMVRRHAFDQIGFLDEGFFFFGEEVDLCYRAQQLGWKVILLPGEPVAHVRAGSSGQATERTLRLYRSKLHYADKHLGRNQTSLIRIMIYVSTLLKLIVYSVRSLVSPDFSPTRDLWKEIAINLRAGELSG